MPAQLVLITTWGLSHAALHPFTLFLKLGWKFYDADDYHPEENRMKMGKGIPLNDQVTFTVPIQVFHLRNSD